MAPRLPVPPPRRAVACWSALLGSTSRPLAIRCTSPAPSPHASAEVRVQSHSNLDPKSCELDPACGEYLNLRVPTVAWSLPCIMRILELGDPNAISRFMSHGRASLLTKTPCNLYIILSEGVLTLTQMGLPASSPGTSLRPSSSRMTWALSPGHLGPLRLS